MLLSRPTDTPAPTTDGRRDRRVLLANSGCLDGGRPSQRRYTASTWCGSCASSCRASASNRLPCTKFGGGGMTPLLVAEGDPGPVLACLRPNPFAKPVRSRRDAEAAVANAGECGDAVAEAPADHPDGPAADVPAAAAGAEDCAAARVKRKTSSATRMTVWSLWNTRRMARQRTSGEVNQCTNQRTTTSCTRMLHVISSALRASSLLRGPTVPVDIPDVVLVVRGKPPLLGLSPTSPCSFSCCCCCCCCCC